MHKLNGPTRWVKQRYDICIFDENTGETILWKKSNYRYWYADPFLTSENDNLYCFVELMDNHAKYGQIGFIDDKGKSVAVINEKYHMSFPNVFKHGERWFMMAETSANHDLHLYVADAFPFKWSFFKVLLEGVKVCDSIFFELENGKYLLTYDFGNDPYKVVIYKFDWAAMKVDEEVCSIPDPQKLLRPAGKVIYKNGKVILPTQKGTNSYGEDVLFNEIKKNEAGGISIVPAEYETHYPKKIIAKYDHKHTYNTCEGKAVLDFSKLVFSPLQIMDGLPCTLKRMLKKH